MNSNTGVISGVRISHDRADVDDISHAGAGGASAALARLLDRPDVEEAFALQTCHRVEAYVVTGEPAAGERALRAAGFDADAMVSMGHEESLRHLMCVAAGLESLVLGEDQVIGQVRDAYETAVAAEAVGPVLREAITKAIHVGERARTETTINEGVVSLSSAGVRLAERTRSLDGATALVVGAGEMGTLAAKAFAATSVESVVVANRTREHAEWVAGGLPMPADATDLGDLAARVAAADVVVAATGSEEPVVTTELLADAGRTLVVDLGQPRDVAAGAASLSGVTVYDLDDLAAVTDATRERRREAAREVEEIVDREFEHLLVQYKRKRADEVIAAMYESAERLKTREVQTALSALDAEGDLTDEQCETVEALADALVSRLLAAPTRSLRDAAEEDDWSTIATALRLFDPAFEGKRAAAVSQFEQAAVEAAEDD